MKSAQELITARLATLEKIKRLCEKKKQECYEDTINFCEEYINVILDAEAKRATMKNSIEVKILFATVQDKFENNYIRFLEPYENRPFCRFESGPMFDKKVMEVYLRKHHFKTKWEKATYFTYYGLNEDAICLTISVKIP